MEIPGYKKYILPLLSFISFLSIVLNVTPLYSQDIPPPSRPPKNIKGFVEIDLSTSVGVRTVVEETIIGEIAKGDAESTRVMARIATRPFRPVEFYLQAGMANLKIDYFNDFFIDYSGDYSLAYGVGTNLYFDPRENFALNLEATLIDQNAIKIGLKLWY